MRMMSFEERVNKAKKLQAEWLENERFLADADDVAARKKAMLRQIEIEEEGEQLGIEFDGDDKPIDLWEKKEETPAKKADRPICPCWQGRWHQETAPEITPAVFALRCDYCQRKFKTRSAAPFDNEKHGVAVGKHYEQANDPI